MSLPHCSTVIAPNEDVEKEACFILGLLAVKPEYQSRIASCGALNGLVRLLPPEKVSKQLKVGEFTRARIVATEGHDLVALPI